MDRKVPGSSKPWKSLLQRRPIAAACVLDRPPREGGCSVGCDDVHGSNPRVGSNFGPACVALASQMIYLRLTESAPPARVSPPGLAPLGSPRREAKPDLPSFLLKEF